MNSMKRYSIGGIFTSLLLVFSIFTLLSISAVSAEEVISVNAEGYENTVIMEFENKSTSKIKTIKMWLGGEKTFKSFKTEHDWGGGESSNGKLLIFTATNTLNPGESAKFGLITSEKVNGINWRALDQNEENIAGPTIVSIQEISHADSSYDLGESEKLEEIKETGSALYGTKRFVPEKIRVDSDIRLVGNGFGSENTLQLFLDDTVLKSVKTDEQGNFLTTVSIPATYKIGPSEFIIKDSSGNFQSTIINIEEAKNRFLKTSEFEINSIPNEIRYDETLTISGSAYPQSAVILVFENLDRVLEKTRVVSANTNGQWVFEETIERSENLGEKYVIFQNNQQKTTQNITIKSDYLMQFSTSAVRYNEGETVSISGTSEPNQSTTIWIKNPDKKIIHYDIFTTNAKGELNYDFVTDDTFDTGTYTLILKQDEGSDAILFGIGQYPSKSVITLMDKTNFSLNSKAILNILSPPLSKLTITILDSNDNIKITETITSSSTGKNRHTLDLDDLSSGVFRAAVTTSNMQDSVKFSIGLEPGSGEISLIATRGNYSPGDSILVIGNTGGNARLTVTLLDPAGNISAQTETFSGSNGSFSTENIGIPSNAELGKWKITANSRLDSKSIDVIVSIPTDEGITLQIEQATFSVGDVITIKGIAVVKTTSVDVEIIDRNGDVVAELGTPITSDNTFSLPWTVPMGFDIGTYTIKAHDTVQHSDSFEIFIE